MRVKNDTCIKSYQLTNTMFLTNEEFGMLIRKLMIEDDEEGFRYDVDKDIKTEYINCEKTWLDEFEEAKKNNPILKQAYMILRGQTQKSRKAFEDLQKVFDKRDGRTKQTAETATEGTGTAKTKKAVEDTNEEENSTETIRNWLQGTDEEIENDKDEIMIEIADNEEFRNNEHINEDQQNGDLFNQLANADLSKEMLAADILKEYLKNVWGE